MEVNGLFNDELNSWSLVIHCHSDICTTTNITASYCFLNEVESGSRNEKDLVVSVCVCALILSQARARKMETKISQMGGGSFGLTNVTANQLLSNEG